jgi:hypothetical protein
MKIEQSTGFFFKFHESQKNKQVVVKQEKALTMQGCHRCSSASPAS